MNKRKKLLLIGDSVFAQVACEYFNYDSDYDVVAFSVERNFLKRDTLFGLPIVPFEELERVYPPDQHDVFVAIVFTQFNRLRARLYREAKAKGYVMASYVSSAAIVRPNARIEEHCFICEENVVQPFATIQNNVVIWSGTQICHRSFIRSNCFILPNCVVSDGVVIGENTILGANVTITSDVTIGRDCFIGPAVLITQSVPDKGVVERIMTSSAPTVPAENA